MSEDRLDTSAPFKRLKLFVRKRKQPAMNLACNRNAIALLPVERFDGLMRRWAALPANVRGAIWMLLAGFAFTAMGTMVKLLGDHLDSFQMAFFRCFFGFAVIWPLLLRNGIRNTFRTDMPLFHLARSLIGATAMGLFFYALTRVPLADLTAISFAKPLFMIFLAVWFLNEVVRWRRWTATIVGFVGVAIMVRPGSSAFDPTVLAALVGTLCVAIAVVLVKKMAAKETTLTMLAYFGAVSSVLMAVPALLAWQWPTPLEWALLVLIGALGCLGQSFIIRAYRIGEATAVAPFDYARLPFATVAGYAAFAEVPDLWTLIGAAVVITSTLYIAHREARRGATARDSCEEARACRAAGTAPTGPRDAGPNAPAGPD